MIGSFTVVHVAAKVEENGKWFCGVHDPKKKRERERLQRDFIESRLAAFERQSLTAKACAGITNEELTNIIKHGGFKALMNFQPTNSHINSASGENKGDTGE